VSKLVLFTSYDEIPRDGASQAFLCTLDDEIKYSHRLGEQIFVARIGSGLASGYEALGKLEHFSSDGAGNSYAHLKQIRPFVETITVRGGQPDRPQMREIEDGFYDEIISMVLGAKSAEEAFSAGFVSQISDRLFTQVERAQQSYCSFSDMVTDDGVATFIRPPEHGGTLHVSNLLFLDGEASELFKAFGWTLGASNQIVVDVYSVTPFVAATVNSTGKLALKTTVTLDADALAWHRQQFIAKRLS